MSTSKNLVSSDTDQKMHGIEGARVIPAKVPQNKDLKKGRNLKAKALKARLIPFWVWVWEKLKVAWDWGLEFIQS